MRPITVERAADAAAVQRLARSFPPDAAHIQSSTQYLGGGTTLLDLMKLDVMRPDRLVDIAGLRGT